MTLVVGGDVVSGGRVGSVTFGGSLVVFPVLDKLVSVVGNLVVVGELVGRGVGVVTGEIVGLWVGGLGFRQT